MSLERDPDKLRDWRRRSQEKYEERLREEGKKFSHLKRTRINPVNPERKRRLREQKFGEKADWISSLPCDTCGAPPPSDPSHYPSRGAGGTKKDLFPQCRSCHEELGAGPETFQRKHDVDLNERTSLYERIWQEEVRETWTNRQSG